MSDAAIDGRRLGGGWRWPARQYAWVIFHPERTHTMYNCRESNKETPVCALRRCQLRARAHKSLLEPTPRFEREEMCGMLDIVRDVRRCRIVRQCAAHTFDLRLRAYVYLLMTRHICQVDVIDGRFHFRTARKRNRQSPKIDTHTYRATRGHQATSVF